MEDKIKETKEEQQEPIVTNCTPLIQKINDDEYILLVGNMQFQVDKKYVKNIFNSARRALGIYLR